MSDQLRDWDNQHVWHPFTPMSAYRDEQAPIISSAEGFHVFDTEGNRYLDGISALWCNVHGYQVPEIDQAISLQLQKVGHTTLLGMSTPTAIELARELVSITPAGLNHVFYSDAGATAVEAALKMVIQYHAQTSPHAPPRTKFVRMAEAYHGDTFGSISVGRVESFHKPFSDLLFDTISVPCPVAYRVPAGYDRESWLQACFDTVDRTFAEHHERIAAFVIEPIVQGAAGILVHAPGYLQHVRNVTAQYNIPLIADEVAVGFGKTGTLFACEQEHVLPDLLCLAKGITGGYLPLAATLATSEIHNAFLGAPAEGKTFYHGHTYTGNALGCAAALANLELIHKNNSVENARQIEEQIHSDFSTLREHAHVGEIRQKGVMTGIELVLDREQKTPYPTSRRIGHEVTLACRKRGFIIRPLGNVIVLMPAIAMPLNLIRQLTAAVCEAIEEICGN